MLVCGNVANPDIEKIKVVLSNPKNHSSFGYGQNKEFDIKSKKIIYIYFIYSNSLEDLTS